MLNGSILVMNFEGVICPQCNVGFAPDTARCPICKGFLVPKDEYKATPDPIVLHDDLSSLVKLRTDGVDWITHLQDKLAEASIPHRTVPSDPPRIRMSFSIYVRPEDLPRAKAIDDEVFAKEVPESEGMHHVEDLDFWSCPACGNRLGEKDLTCSSCGLALSAPEVQFCGTCNMLLAPDIAKCPRCGSNVGLSRQ
jgi:RNA polymerase subunit RPABC4/transcription elongation factor Spt4